MHLLKAYTGIDLKELLLGNEEWFFLIEASLRSFIMFVVILVGLRLLGKRGIRQLSVFELVVIIGLGTAAGDPMVYRDIGILPALIVFAMIIGLYKLVTFCIAKSKKFESLVEGSPVCLIKDGVFTIDNFRKESLGEDEFFAELRMKSVSQLGQVEEAIVESSGEMSLFFFSDEEVRYGLPIMPRSLDAALVEITKPGHYACTFCGYTDNMQPIKKITCPSCKRNEWVEASIKKRVS